MSYFSNQGTAIYSGAAGYGGPLTAYQDGSLGSIYGRGRRRIRSIYDRPPRPIRRGKVQGFGAGMGGFGAGMGLMAYQDGSLGGHGYGPREAFQDGSLGQSGSGPLMSYQDGSLGMPLFLETAEGIQQLEDPVTLYHGSMGEYFSGTAGCRGCGVGQATAAAVPVLDLSDPISAIEVKKTLFMAPWMSAAAALERYHDEMDNPVWTVKTAELVGAWVSGFVEFLYKQEKPPAEDKAKFIDNLVATSFEGEYYIPTVLGIRQLYTSAIIGATAVGIPPADAVKALPVLSAFMQADADSGGTGAVLPPVIEGQGSGIKNNMLAIGFGVAALAVVGLVMVGGKKKRS